jgi:hypothetical protein
VASVADMTGSKVAAAGRCVVGRRDELDLVLAEWSPRDLITADEERFVTAQEAGAPGAR